MGNMFSLFFALRGCGIIKCPPRKDKRKKEGSSRCSFSCGIMLHLLCTFHSTFASWHFWIRRAVTSIDKLSFQLDHNSSWSSACASAPSLFLPSESPATDWSLWGGGVSSDVESVSFAFSSLLAPLFSVSFFGGFSILGFGLGIRLTLAT